MSNAMRVGIFLALLLLLPLAQGQSCTSVPANGCDLTHDVTLTPGTYFLPNGMDATTDNVRLNCNGGTIRGSNVEGEHGVLGVFRTNVTVRNCRFEDFNPPSFGSGVFFAQSHFITVQDSIFEDTAFGISINGTVANEHIVIKDNLFIRTRRDNLLLKANFSVARGNTFLLSTEENALHTDGAHNLIEDNVFDSPNTQLLSFQIQNITVRRNSFRGTGETTTAAVLFLPFAGGTFEDITFVDNRVEDAYVTFGDYSSPGITHNGLTVSRNTFKDVGWVQVDFWDGSVISHNNGTRLVFGIQFAGGRDHLVQGNRLTGPGCTDFTNAPPPFGTNPTCNRINIIVLSAPVVTEDLTVQHNRMSDAQFGSFVVGDGGPGGLTDAAILNNTISNSRGGMIILDGSGLTIKENHVEAEINDMHLTSSTVQGNAFAGDQFNVSDSGSTFTDNTFDGIAVTDTGVGHIWCVGITGNSYINGATYAGNNPGGGSCEPAGDLSVEDLDPVQVVEVPILVQGKKGVIRSQVQWTSGRVQSTLVTLTHKLIPTGPGSPVALGSANIEVSRDTNESVLFNFTPSVPEGNYLVSVEAESAFTESNVGNNLESEFVEVVDTDSVQVVYVPVGFDPSEFGDFLDAVFAHHQFLTMVYPLSEEDARSGLVGVAYNPSPFTLSVIPLLLRNLYNHAVRFGPNQPERVAGIFPAGLLPTGGYSFWPSAFGVDRTVVAQDSTRHTTAHEIGHTFQLCDETEQLKWFAQDGTRLGGCPNGDHNLNGFLDQDCIDSQGCPTVAIFGLIPWQNEIVPRPLYEDNPMNNLMGSTSSHNTRWIDSVTYLHLSREFQTAVFTNVSERILIPGSIVRDGSGFEVLFEPLEELGPGEVLVLENQTGNFSLEFLDSEGEILASFNFIPTFSFSSADDSEEETNISAFSLVAERPVSVSRVQVRSSDAVLGGLNRSLHHPTVQVISPFPNSTYQQTLVIAWEGADQDNDPLSYVVGISSDEGLSWHSLSDPVTNTSIIFDINASLLGPSDGFLIRVRASDGFLSGEAIMNVSFGFESGCADSDGDSVCDISDNCIEDSNPLQLDLDGNRYGDACDNPREHKNESVIQLESSKVGLRKVDDAIDRVIKFVDGGLDDGFWVEDFRLELKMSSNAVFVKEAQAVSDMVRHLGKCGLRSGLNTVPPSVNTTFEEVSDKLVQADKLLAMRNLKDARATAPLADPHRQLLVTRLTEMAQEELDAGLDALEEECLSTYGGRKTRVSQVAAIQRFRRSWVLSTLAQKVDTGEPYDNFSPLFGDDNEQRQVWLEDLMGGMMKVD